MRKPAAAVGIALASIILGVGLVGCDSGSKSTSTTSSTTSATSATSATKSSASSSAPSTSAQASGPNQTLNEYIKQNNIQETVVHRGDAGSPTINLPVPQGWTTQPATEDASYGAITFDAAADPNVRPIITAHLEKLTGTLDQKGLFAAAHGDAKNLPGFSETDPVQDSTLGGFPATQIGGTYTAEGKKYAVYDKTVMIEGPNGTFVFQLVAQATDAERDKLQEAMSAIDQQTTITA
jgi:hypothetical protein